MFSHADDSPAADKVKAMGQGHLVTLLSGDMNPIWPMSVDLRIHSWSDI